MFTFIIYTYKKEKFNYVKKIYVYERVYITLMK